MKVVGCVLVLALAACHGTTMATPDAGPTTDATTETSGLYVHWWTDPYVPGDVGNNTNVATALFRLTSLQVIGDASPGDPSTTEIGFTINWTDDHRPDEISFKQAPVGLYSQVSLQLDGIVDNTYEITGQVTISGQAKPFEIHDLDPMSLSISMSKMLVPNHASDVTVHIDFAGAMSAVDWTKVTHVDDGTLELDTFDDQMPAFRAKLMQSFNVGSDESAPQ